MAQELTHEEAHDMYSKILEAYDSEEVDWPVGEDNYESLITSTNRTEKIQIESGGDLENEFFAHEFLANIPLDMPFYSAEHLADKAMKKLLEEEYIETEHDYRRSP